MAFANERKEVRTMDYNCYFEGEFEPLGDSKKTKKSKEKKRFLKKAKKFFRKLCDKVVNTVLSTFSQMALHFFDKKLEKMYA